MLFVHSIPWTRSSSYCYRALSAMSASVFEPLKRAQHISHHASHVLSWSLFLANCLLASFSRASRFADVLATTYRCLYKVQISVMQQHLLIAHYSIVFHVHFADHPCRCRQPSHACAHLRQWYLCICGFRILLQHYLWNPFRKVSTLLCVRKSDNEGLNPTCSQVISVCDSLAFEPFDIEGMTAVLLAYAQSWRIVL